MINNNHISKEISEDDNERSLFHLENQDTIRLKTEELKSEIENKYGHQTKINKIISGNSYKNIDLSEIIYKDNVTIKNIYFNNTQYIGLVVRLPVVLAVMYFYRREIIITENINSIDFWFSLICVITLAFLIYYSFIKKKKKFIDFEQDFLSTHEGEKIYYVDILTTGILTLHYRSGLEQTVILGKINKEIIKLSTVNIEMSAEKLIKIIQTKINVAQHASNSIAGFR